VGGDKEAALKKWYKELGRTRRNWADEKKPMQLENQKTRIGRRRRLLTGETSSSIRDKGERRMERPGTPPEKSKKIEWKKKTREPSKRVGGGDPPCSM